ncbi:MAG: T9SS type A sorting domain-containing protein [bacterium]|nr:T9SS type A sorting domain-containing protein [bacterium]
MKKATKRLLEIFMFSILLSGMTLAQYTTPTIDGSIGSSEYGSHTDGENKNGNWYVTWDATNLYIGLTSSNTGESAVFYLGTRTDNPINGGVNSDGTLIGFNYDGTNFTELPFRAKAVFYVKSSYREYRTSNGSNGWSSQTSGFGSYSDNGSNTREFTIPWSVVGGIPSSFSFFGYVTSSSGFVYNQVPSANASGSIGTSARYGRYYVVTNTTDGSSMKPFSGDSYVFNSASDISDFGTISVYDFTMNSNGSTITRSSASSNNWTIENNLVVADGTINFNSTSSTATVESIQVTGGTLTLSGSGSTTADNVTFSSGTITTNNGLSVNSGGSFYQTGGTLSGNITTNRQITGDAGWRLLSLPKTGGTVQDVSDDSPVQGVSGGDDASADANFIIYDSDATFEQPTNVSTAWGDGLGFGLYFYNNTTNGSSTLPVTLDASGAEPSSDVTVTLNPAASGYTLVGNPYASNYNTNSMTATSSNISNTIAFWNDGTSSYSTQDRTASSGYIISPWQGFWVQTVSAAATTLTIPTSGKTSSSTTGTFFSKEVNNRGDINFSLSSESTYDEAIRLAFRSEASIGYDTDDFGKLTPLVPSYATMAFESNDILKSVESLPYNLEEEVTLSLQPQMVGVSGDFSFAWNGLETIPGEWELILHDYETGANINMRDESEYTFFQAAHAKVSSSPLSLLNGPAAVAMKAKAEGNRFGITIRPTSVSNETEETPALFALEQNYPNPFNPSTTISYSVQEAGAVNISVYNLMGQKVATLVDETKAAGQYNVRWNAAGAASGMYYYRLEAGGQSITRKMTLIK